MNKFYITTAIDYTNDVIHIGHIYQKVFSDSIARYYRACKVKTYFLTGTDEHGQKVEKAAKENKENPKEFVDKISKLDKGEQDSMDISYDRFIRTTDTDHIKFAQDFYLKSKANNDIYLSNYKGLYCEGCEAFVDNSDLVDGKCPLHPTRVLVEISEENYFFRLSKYQDFLIDLFNKNPKFVEPESKRNEVLAFIKKGLKDFSISRTGVSWGIPVPDDPKHTIYVWFDALINYLTYGDKEKCWPADLHVLGKDNAKFHAIYWPAMLKSAGYELPKKIFVHDFFSLNGQKISKSLGNVIRPTELTKKYGSDPVRYYFLRYGPNFNDVDVSIEKLENSYNFDLANGLGNLVSRVRKLAYLSKIKYEYKINNFSKEIHEFIKGFEVNHAIEFIWTKVKEADTFLNKNEVWKQKGVEKNKSIIYLIDLIAQIGFDLSPFLPQTSKKIADDLKNNNFSENLYLFPRLD